MKRKRISEEQCKSAESLTPATHAISMGYRADRRPMYAPIHSFRNSSSIGIATNSAPCPPNHDKHYSCIFLYLLNP